MVTRIGITGHQSLAKRLRDDGALHSESEAWTWVEGVFAGLVTDNEIVVSSLAGGADQRLSRVATERGARIEVVIPSADYLETLNQSDRDEYKRLLDCAIEVIRLNFPEPSESAFFAAGKSVVDRSDTIVAVWDGQPAEGLGGTGDIIAYAHDRDKDVLQLDPIRRTIQYLRDGVET